MQIKLPEGLRRVWDRMTGLKTPVEPDIGEKVVPLISEESKPTLIDRTRAMLQQNVEYVLDESTETDMFGRIEMDDIIAQGLEGIKDAIADLNQRGAPYQDHTDVGAVAATVAEVFMRCYDSEPQEICSDLLGNIFAEHPECAASIRDEIVLQELPKLMGLMHTEEYDPQDADSAGYYFDDIAKLFKLCEDHLPDDRKWQNAPAALRGSAEEKEGLQPVIQAA